MGIIIDIVVIALILLSIILAYKKGLVSLAISLLAFVIAIVVTMVLYIPVSSFIINNTAIDETIQNTILTKASEVIEENTKEDLTGKIIDEAMEGTLEGSSEQIARSIVTGGTIILIFVITRIALIFVKALAELAAKIPVLKQLNEVGGAIYGLIRGILIIYTILLVINIFTLINPRIGIDKNIKDTYITKIMYEYNVINLII